MSEPATDAQSGKPAGAGDAEPSLSALAAVLRRVDLEALAVSMVEAYRDQIEAYRRLPRSVLYGRKLDITRDNLDLFVRLAEEERDITDADIDGPREAVRLDVNDGIPLEGVLQAYQIGGALAWRTIADAAEPEEHATGLLAATHLYVSFSERVSAVVCDVYAAELKRRDAGSNQVALAAFEALVGATAGSDELARRAKAANLRLAGVYTPFVARRRDDSNLDLARALRAASVFVVQNAGDVVGFVQKAGDERALTQAEAAFALAPQTPRDRLESTFDGLRQLVEIAARMGFRRRIEEREFLLERSLLNSPALDDVLQRLVVAPLAAHDAAHGSELVHTLHSFVDSGLRRKVAAQALHVHPNTLDCRLARIGALTGLDLARPHDLAQAIVAMSRAAIGRDRATA